LISVLRVDDFEAETMVHGAIEQDRLRLDDTHVETQPTRRDLERQVVAACGRCPAGDENLIIIRALEHHILDELERCIPRR
jgi:hypothetical protein